MTTYKGIGRPRLVEEEKAQAIVADYQKGDKLTKIEEKHGVPRATIYWLLERSGITADLRVKRNVRYQVDSVTATVYLDKIAELEDYISNFEPTGDGAKQTSRSVQIIGEVSLPQDDLKSCLDVISRYARALESATESLEAEARKSAPDEWPSVLSFWHAGEDLKKLNVGVKDLLELQRRADAACQVLRAKQREELKRGKS
jgi:hypothetical protein